MGPHGKTGLISENKRGRYLSLPLGYIRMQAADFVFTRRLPDFICGVRHNFIFPGAQSDASFQGGPDENKAIRLIRRDLYGTLLDSARRSAIVSAKDTGAAFQLCQAETERREADF